MKRNQELEYLLQESKNRSTHIAMNVETKSFAIHEVSSRNEILNESLDKVKLELFNARRTLTQTESDKFDLEKEVLRLRREAKHFESQWNFCMEEKEHLISMLELKNHIIKSGGGGSTPDSNTFGYRQN